MGFFSKFKKQPPEHPIEYYLEQRSAKKLLEAGKAGLVGGAYINDYEKAEIYENTLPRKIAPQLYTVYSRDSFSFRFNESNTEEIPKWYAKNINLFCWDVLKISAKKGNGLAALYLAIGYEHGIENLNEEEINKADQYYSMSVTLDSGLKPLVDLINLIKSDMWFRRDFTNDQNETLAMNMFLCNIEGWKYYDALNALDNNLKRTFLRLSSILLCFYASNGSAWATGTLANDLIKDKLVLKELGFKLEDNSLLGVDSKVITREKVGKVMLYELWERANAGDQVAKNYCQQFDIYF